ncbi:MAG: hypothetical protein HC917_12515 [Richelia sp. SM2_1_7]|nr:hypothetical protein [Richelia sp. SM2_1_7]
MRAEDEADCDVSAELLLQECSKTLFQKRSNCSRNAVMPVNSLEQEMLKTYQEHSVDHKISPEVRSLRGKIKIMLFHPTNVQHFTR